MALLKLIGLTAALGIASATATGWYVNSRDETECQAVSDALLGQREAAPTPYDPAMVAGMPEVAQRYFARAIAPGTSLHRIVRLEMTGPAPTARRSALRVFLTRHRCG